MDSGGSIIKVNEASIIDLKAELLKKEKQLQSEHKTSTQDEDYSTATASGSKTFGKLLQLATRKRQKAPKKAVLEVKEEERTLSHEDTEAFIRSKAMLESKAQIYDKIMKGEMEDPEDENGESQYLVEFYMKKDKVGCLPKDEEEDGKLSEYTPTLLSNDMRREQLRQKWEKEQEELMKNPDLAVHYANVQFDEIREHGVGFYQFSKDQEERKTQLEKLQKLREQTLKQREKREEVKEKRKAALEARLAKVRQRKQGGATSEQQADTSDQSSLFDNLPNNKLLSQQQLTSDERLNAEDSASTYGNTSDVPTTAVLNNDKVSQPKRVRREPLIGTEVWLEVQRQDRNPSFAPPSSYSQRHTSRHRGRGTNTKTQGEPFGRGRFHTNTANSGYASRDRIPVASDEDDPITAFLDSCRDTGTEGCAR